MKKLLAVTVVVAIAVGMSGCCHGKFRNAFHRGASCSAPVISTTGLGGYTAGRPISSGCSNCGTGGHSGGCASGNCGGGYSGGYTGDTTPYDGQVIGDTGPFTNGYLESSEPVRPLPSPAGQ